MFSDLFGGSAGSTAQAVAVNAAGQVLVTGPVSSDSSSPFPATAGAYNIPRTANHPFLLELDPPVRRRFSPLPESAACTWMAA
jgi:hypothetical protein